MKKLILVRHGKSSWKHNLPDPQRPLKSRATLDANVVTKAFKNVFKGSLIAWSSPAVRALETAKMFKNALDVEDVHFLVKDTLYTFDENQLLDVISQCDDMVSQLMVFGHNPATTEVVNSLGNQDFNNVPTTGLVLIEFDTNSWKTLKNGKTVLHLFPKNLR